MSHATLPSVLIALRPRRCITLCGATVTSQLWSERQMQSNPMLPSPVTLLHRRRWPRHRSHGERLIRQDLKSRPEQLRLSLTAKPPSPNQNRCHRRKRPPRPRRFQLPRLYLTSRDTCLVHLIRAADMLTSAVTLRGPKLKILGLTKFLSCR